MGNDASADMVERDQAAWQRLTEVLRSADQLWTDLGGTAPELDRATLVDLLLDVLQQEQLPQSFDETGRIRVLSAASVRALSVPYLFFAGLSEKAFPPPEREDRLYSEAESQRLKDLGLPLVLRGERSQEEMLLFYEVLTRATRTALSELSGPGRESASAAAEPLSGRSADLARLRPRRRPRCPT